MSTLSVILILAVGAFIGIVGGKVVTKMWSKLRGTS